VNQTPYNNFSLNFETRLSTVANYAGAILYSARTGGGPTGAAGGLGGFLAGNGGNAGQSGTNGSFTGAEGSGGLPGQRGVGYGAGRGEGSGGGGGGGFDLNKMWKESLFNVPDTQSALILTITKELRTSGTAEVSLNGYPLTPFALAGDIRVYIIQSTVGNIVFNTTKSVYGFLVGRGGQGGVPQGDGTRTPSAGGGGGGVDMTIINDKSIYLSDNENIVKVYSNNGAILKAGPGQNANGEQAGIGGFGSLPGNSGGGPNNPGGGSAGGRTPKIMVYNCRTNSSGNAEIAAQPGEMFSSNVPDRAGGYGGGIGGTFNANQRILLGRERSDRTWLAAGGCYSAGNSDVGVAFLQTGGGGGGGFDLQSRFSSIPNLNSRESPSSAFIIYTVPLKPSTTPLFNTSPVWVG